MSPERAELITEALANRRLATADELAEARGQAEAEGTDVLDVLVNAGRVRRTDALAAVAGHLGVEFLDLSAGFLPDPDAISRLDATVAVSENALPVRVGESVLLVAVADPLDEAKRQRLEAVSHLAVEMTLAAEQQLTATVRRVYLAGPAGTASDTSPLSVVAEMSDSADDVGYHINELLEILLEHGGSDLHLSAGSPPLMRRNGGLEAMAGYAALRPAELRTLVYDILSARQREELEDKLELDASHPVPGRGRFRTNVFFQRGSIGAVMRAIPNRVPTLTELGMPPVVAEFATKPRGLVLVTGATGSGKSTTLAAMVDLINSEQSVHVITVEDPIEFMHPHRQAVVNQREVGGDTLSFASALRHALRQDPDVILVGEMRDLETMSTVLTAAETGHLVFATLHTQDAPGSVERIIDVFPPFQQHQVRVQLAETLQGVISQQLVPNTDRSGRVPAVEVLVATPAVRNLIRESKVPQIKSAMQSGGQHGMQTMDKSLAQLVRSGRVDLAVATERASSPDDFMNLLGGHVR